MRASGPQSSPPNILYIHSHDTGRYVQPYGYAVPTPNIQLLADQGVLFREAFCAMPTCSGSRACLLTGQGGVGNGMLGLAHRGWRLNDYGHHLVHPLREAGYRSTLIGEQHISVDPDEIGYDEVIPIDTSHANEVAPKAIESLRRAHEPFFASVGFFETHRALRRPDLGPRHALLAAAAEPSRHPAHARGHGRVQGQRPLARPGDRRRPQRASTPTTWSSAR